MGWKDVCLYAKEGMNFSLIWTVVTFLHFRGVIQNLQTHIGLMLENTQPSLYHDMRHYMVWRTDRSKIGIEAVYMYGVDHNYDKLIPDIQYQK